VTVADWLESRSPAPPAQLLDRLRGALGSSLACDAAEVPHALVDAAETLLATLVPDGCMTRDRALDLLAVDALVTYAFEAASDDPEALAARARDAMRRLADLAVRAGQ
jgi:hypothetical protein